MKDSGPQRDKAGRLTGGNPGNSGGKRGRSGRPPDAFRELCRQALENADGMEVIKRMISGDIKEPLGRTKMGEPIYGETKNSDRLRAIEWLANYAEGKAPQTIEVKDVSPQTLETGEEVANRLREQLPRFESILALEQDALMGS